LDYPFAALVGQEQLKTALLLNAVQPSIGGVLIRGEKGTAKSTAARGLAALLPPLRVVPGCPFNCAPEALWVECPHCGALAPRPVAEVPAPFVDLPLGATEDRVLGTLDLEKVLREGRRAFQPGLLAAAHRGILYIDEVNLLPDHLVDVLLDSAALGVSTVQREGVAVTHPARFLLVGTMNPEEGDLRPQLLDRFGLVVAVAGPREPAVRAEVVRRRLDFEADPVSFVGRWSVEQTVLRERIVTARARLPQVVLADELLTLITQLCCAFEVDGLRADIALHKAARTLAALEGRLCVGVEDIRTAAELVLPHRQRRRPFESPELDRNRLDDLLSASGGCEPPAADEQGVPPSTPHSPAPESERVFSPAPPQNIRRIEVSTTAPLRAAHGRRNSGGTRDQGHYVRAVSDEHPSDLALAATLRAAAQRGSRVDGRLAIERTDLHRKERAGRTGTLILFVVDASGSMAARRRMEAVKGAVLSLLQSAYEQRDEVGVIAFRGLSAEVVLPPTDSVELAERALRVLPTGGRTPLAHALVLARDLVRRARRDEQDRLVLLVVLSDGKANVSVPDSTGEPWQQSLGAAVELAADRVPALVLDTEVGFVRMGRAQQLADALAAEYLVLEELSAQALVLKVRSPEMRQP
jgi:magnesium chelatase subunit D